MITEEEYVNWSKLPQSLTIEELNDPDKVIAEFFNFYSLQGCRDDLKKWFHAALEDDICPRLENYQIYSRSIKTLKN